MPRNVLLVGGSSSIGPAIVDRYSAAGDHVTATYHSHPPANPSATAAYIQADITDPQDRAALTTAVADRGGLDVVLLFAGLLPGNNLPAYDPALAERVVDVNFTGQALLLQALLPHLRDPSSVLVMSSVSGQRGSFDPFYAAAKAAVLGFVKSMARALAPATRVNAIAPALIADSAMHDAMAPEIREGHRGQTPTGEFVAIADLAAQVFDLTQPHWRNLNGACIDLNGGAYVR